LFDTGGKSTNPSNGIITAEEYKKAQDSFRAENIEFSSNLFKTYNAYYKNSD
jgi:hypothetical protein